MDWEDCSQISVFDRVCGLDRATHAMKKILCIYGLGGLSSRYNLKENCSYHIGLMKQHESDAVCGFASSYRLILACHNTPF